MRKIAVVTGTRAEYGLLYWVIKGIHEEKGLALQLIVTGMHLSPGFGFTVKEIEKDGFPIAERVEMLLSSDTEMGIASSMGLGLLGFAKAYERLRPDILVLLGDRFEAFSAASAAVPFRIPIAHIHGGEATEGAIDEQFRYAMTKMSHIHFPATSTSSRRIIQMGEDPEAVFCFGAPGLDNIVRLTLLKRDELAEALGLPEEKPWGILTYHPATLEKGKAKAQIEALLCAVEPLTQIYWIFTMPNADAESGGIIQSIEEFVERDSQRGKVFVSLGQLRYLSLLRQAVVMVGNSSSGIIEAPSFELPVVNIGSRQRGRIRALNVIDVPVCEKGNITEGIVRATSKGFRESLRGMSNPYGDGNASEGIVRVLKTVDLEHRLKKQFHELQTSGRP